MPRFRLAAETIDEKPTILWCMEVGETISLAGLVGYELLAFARQRQVNEQMMLRPLEAIWNDVLPGKRVLPDVIATYSHEAILRGLVWLNEIEPILKN